MSTLSPLHTERRQPSAGGRVSGPWVAWGRYATNGHRTFRRSGEGWQVIAPVFARVAGHGAAVQLTGAGLDPAGGEVEFTAGGVQRSRILAAALDGTGIDARAVMDALTKTHTTPAELRHAWRGLSLVMAARDYDTRGGAA